MTDRIGVTKNSPNTSFWLEADVVSYNASGGYATVYLYLRAANGPSGTSGSQFNGAGNQVGYIQGAEFGRVSGNPFLPGGYGANQTRWRSGPWGINVAMSGEATIGLSMYLGYGNISEWYGGSIYIPWAPAAPTPIGIDQETPTSLRYRFSGNSANGSTITGWQAQIATDAGFTTGVQTVSSGGTTIFTDLSPASTYYFRSRGANGVGWGAWSQVISGMTLSGAYISINGVWVGVPVYVSNGTNWVLPELLVSNGTAWKEAI